LYSNILAVNNNNTRRATNDIFEVATSSSGIYLYYNNTSVFGHINVTDSALSWYIDSNGLTTFQTVNCKKLSVENIKQKTIVMNTLYEYNLLTTSPQMIYLNSASDSIFFNLNPLGESCNFNIYEFRLQTSNVNSIMRFRGSNFTPQCPIIDLNNNSIFYLMMIQNKDIIDFNIFINFLEVR